MTKRADEPEQVEWEGRFIAAKRRGKWEYVSRTRNISAAAILAVDTDDEGDHVILVEQYRVPVQAMCLELPAGLIGDEEEGEAVELAATRELEEETGFRAENMVNLGRFHASPGMSSEGFFLMRAEGLTKVGPGGGVAGEDIAVHRVPLSGIAHFVAGKRVEGCTMDVKLLLLLASGWLSAPA